MRQRCVLLVLVLAALAVLLAPQTALAAANCADCHAAGKGDFTVASVDYAKCRSCHWLSSHPEHGVTDQCGACHASWPSRSDFYVGSYNAGAAGFFTSAASTSKSKDELHVIHMNGSWPRSVSTSVSKCASCHAAASCNACHGSPVAHGEHPQDLSGNFVYPPVTTVVASGTVAGVLNTDSSASLPVTCINSSCHDKAAVGSSIQVTTQQQNAFTTVPAPWATMTNSRASGGSLYYAKVAGNTATIQVVGPATVELIGTKLNSGGRATVKLDGAAQATVDFYSSAQLFRNVMWTGSIPSGTHTLVVTALGTKSAGYGTYVMVDALRISRAVIPVKTFKPSCSDSCHSTMHATDRTLCYSCHGPALRTYDGSSTIDPTKHAQVTSSTKALILYPGQTSALTPCDGCHAGHSGTRAAGDALCSACHDASGLTYPANYSYRGGTAWAGSQHRFGTTCSACHAPHGKPDGAGGTRAGLLYDTEEKSCTGNGTGACHSSAANSQNGVNIYAAVRSGASTSTQHDLTAAQQASSGARILCSDCHNPHRDNRTAKYISPDNKGATPANDNAFCLSCHDGSAPAGITFPVVGALDYRTLLNVAPLWSASKHGGVAGGGYGGGLLNYVRGNAALSCVTCHEPHGSSNAYHVKTAVNGKTGISVSTGASYNNLCNACHTGDVNTWHATCNACHSKDTDSYGYTDPDAHAGYQNPYPVVTATTDCSRCHGHGQTWQHSGRNVSSGCAGDDHCVGPQFSIAF